ncbi:MAG: hypothetical protein ACK4KV_18480 [Rhodocyclaceae bacterium]
MSAHTPLAIPLELFEENRLTPDYCTRATRSHCRRLGLSSAAVTH